MWILLCTWCLFMHYMSDLHDICFTFPKDIFFKIFNAFCRLWHHRASTNYHWNFRFNQTVTRHCRHRHWTEVRERFRFPLKTCTDTGIIEHYLEGFTERRVVLAPELIWLQTCHLSRMPSAAGLTRSELNRMFHFLPLSIHLPLHYLWLCYNLWFTFNSHDRKKFGLLEKHKDYVVRAKAFHKKEETLRVGLVYCICQCVIDSFIASGVEINSGDYFQKLKEKAAFRNPDEFYFKMIKTKTVDGVHRPE